MRTMHATYLKFLVLFFLRMMALKISCFFMVVASFYTANSFYIKSFRRTSLLSLRASSDEQTINDLNLEEMFEVFEAAGTLIYIFEAISILYCQFTLYSLQICRYHLQKFLKD